MSSSAISPIVLFGRIISPPPLESTEKGDYSFQELADQKCFLLAKAASENGSCLIPQELATAAENGSFSSQESALTAENGSFFVQETTNSPKGKPASSYGGRQIYSEVQESPIQITSFSLQGSSPLGDSVDNCEASESKERDSAAVISGTNEEAASFHSGKRMRCPRCESYDTKFCYFNNYNVKQPRHFCRNCQRYWTAGGSLRNVPVGAGRRRNKTGSKQAEEIAAIEATSAAAVCNTGSNNYMMSQASPSTSSASSLPSSTAPRYTMQAPLPSPSSSSSSSSSFCSVSALCSIPSSRPLPTSLPSPSLLPSASPQNLTSIVNLQPGTKLEDSSFYTSSASSSSSCVNSASQSQAYYQMPPSASVSSSVGVPFIWPLPWPCQVSSPSPGGVLLWPYQAWPPASSNANSHLPSNPHTTAQRFPLPSPSSSLPPQHPKSHNLHHHITPNTPSFSAFQPFNSSSSIHRSNGD